VARINGAIYSYSRPIAYVHSLSRCINNRNVRNQQIYRSATTAPHNCLSVFASIRHDKLLIVLARYMNHSTPSTPKIFLVLLELLGFVFSCNLTFIPLIDFTTAVIFKPIVNCLIRCIALLDIFVYYKCHCIIIYDRTIVCQQ